MRYNASQARTSPRTCALLAKSQRRKSSDGGKGTGLSDVETSGGISGLAERGEDPIKANGRVDVALQTSHGKEGRVERLK